MTKGQLLFWGGIAGAIIFTVLFAVSWIMFERKKRQLMQKIEEEL